MNILSVLCMGLTSVLAQITVLRRFMTVFSGNELDIGITLSVWFTAVALGSYAGSRIRSPRLFSWSFIVLGFLVQPTILSIDLVRPFFSIGFGEVIPFSSSLLSTSVILAPLCMVTGAQFPLAVSSFSRTAPVIYSIEGLGAFFGGIFFTFFFSGTVSTSLLSAGVGMMNCLIALSLIRKRYLIGVILIPILWYIGTGHVEKLLTWKGTEAIKKVESRYGEIALLKMENQFSLYSSGRFNFSYPDPPSEELRAHIPASLHPSPLRILVIGGSPAVLRELLKYPVSDIDFVDIDPANIEISLSLLTEDDRRILNDRRLQVKAMDGREYIKGPHDHRYDLVIFNIPEPSTANLNRFYTVEFFREVKRILNEGGIIFLSLQKASGYVGRRIQQVNGSVCRSLKEVFLSVGVSSEEYGIFFAGNGPVDADPAFLEERFRKRNVQTSYFHASLFRDIFDPLRVSMVSERLGTVETPNTDMRPVAYLYNLLVWAEIQGSSFLMALLAHWRALMVSIGIILILLSMLLWKKRRAVYFTFFTVGYSSMAFAMVIILAYQAAFGYVYEMIGLLTASFMAGNAAGAYAFRDMRRPLNLLRILEGLTILLLLLSIPLFRNELFFYLLSFAGGMLGGAEFSGANRFLKKDGAAETAGRLYALDLAGSFIGTLFTAIVCVPLLGIPKTVLFVVCIKALSLILLTSMGNEKH